MTDERITIGHCIIWWIGWITCFGMIQESYGGASAVDKSAHYACIDQSGFINFDAIQATDGTQTCYDSYSYGYGSPRERLGKSGASVCSDWNNCYNYAHSDLDGVVYYRDSQGYFWCGVFDATTKEYLGVIAKTEDGTCPLSINTVVSPTGAGTIECTANPVEAGDASTCTATANPGYSFGSFTGDTCSTSGNTCTFTNVATAKTLTANFVAAGYTITTNVNIPGSGTVTCTPNPVEHGTATACTATPNQGYLFDSFDGDCTGATCAFANITGAKTVTGNFHLASDPFLGNTIVLQPQDGALVALPGVGPGGITLYAAKFTLDNFTLAPAGFVTSGADLLGHYNANFHAEFLDNYGAPAVSGGVAGRVDIEGSIDNFQALYKNRASETQSGQFDVTLAKAEFAGPTSLGTPMAVSLANIPNATLTIGGPSRYLITYQVPFSIDGQYALNGGNNQGVPDLDAGYQVTTSANPTGGGSVTCSPNPVRQGGSSTCIATPNDGYRLGSFSGDCSGATCLISNVTGPKTVTANFIVGPDPFLGRTVVLKPQSGALVPLPGVGPGGATLYASEFLLDNFTLAPAGFVTTNTTHLLGHYNSDFHAQFLDAQGAPVSQGGVSGRADLTGGIDNFQVLYANRTDEFATGRFVLVLQKATFTGLTSLNLPMTVSLADVPNADVTLGGSPNYTVNYTTPFTINGQYNNQTVPPLAATHTITATANPTAGGTVTCNPDSVIQGNGSTCTATPAQGYKFTAFSGDCTGATCVFTNVTGPKTVTANFAFASDPFIGQTVILQTTPGTLATLPGVGPGGATLYANQFIIDNFAIDPTQEFTVSGANLIGVYDADFHAVFLKADGTPAVQDGVAGRADLTGRVNNFRVRYDNRTSPFTSGTFNMGLELATFGGVTSAGANMVVSLGTPEPTARVTIGAAPNYPITYITPFTINGQYAMNGGAPTAVPGLAADNFDITTSVTPANSGTVACSPDPVPKNQTSSCTVTANAGYSISTVTGCGGTWVTNPYVTGAMTANCALTATFVALPAGAIVTPTSGLVTTEAGGTRTFTVKLNSKPTANVTIGVSSSRTTEGTVAPASLVFTSTNWGTAQTVTVTGVDDNQVDGPQIYTIVTTATTSADPIYNGLAVADVLVTNVDNDTASTGNATNKDVDHIWRTISMAPATLVNSTIASGALNGAAVLIAGVPTYNGGDPGVAQVRNVSASGFDLHFQEWNYQDQGHTKETIDYLMLKSGRATFIDGTIIEVGKFDLSGTNAWKTISFQGAFPSQPYLFLTVQTANDPDVVAPRARTVTNASFQAALFEQESKMNGHPNEMVGYLAMYNPNGSGTLNLGGVQTPYILQKVTGDSRWTPVLSQRIFIQEETSMDSKTVHADESLHFLALGNRIFAQQTSNNDADPAALRRRTPLTPTAEWGIWRNGVNDVNPLRLQFSWRTLTFANTYTNPVVVVKPVSNLNAEPGVVGLRNVTKTSAELSYREWYYLVDGVHTTLEDVFYMVVESGARRIPATATGLMFRAGRISTSNLALDGQWSTVTIVNPTSTGNPAVFASVMSGIASDIVTTRIQSVTRNGFKVAMDEQELNDNGHGPETIGWVTIDAGSVTSTDGRMLQAFTRAAAVSSTAAPVTYTGNSNSRYPVVIADVDSTIEADPITLRFANLTNTQLDLSLAEEKSLDAEVTHAPEDIGVFVGD